MKRSGPLKRKTPLKQGESALKRTEIVRKTALERTARLVARTPIARSKPKAVSTDEVRARQAWHAAATRGRCLVCRADVPTARARGTRLQGHHAIRQQTLRRRARELGIEEWRLVWDQRVGVPLCAEPCHRQHHSGKVRVQRSRLPLSVAAFAKQYGLEYVLDREYES